MQKFLFLLIFLLGQEALALVENNIHQFQIDFMQQKQSLAQKLVAKLREKGKKITIAESCTGGGLGQIITSISGSSKVFSYGFITYSDEAKNKILKVDWNLLNNYGAVSPEVAQSLAVGALKISNADLAISITGFAGPGGDQPGLVFIGLAEKNQVISYKFQFKGEREEVRNAAIIQALKLALQAFQ
jgi:PncC family amidohydrolase